ncbi:MAG: radical SAM protein [Pseudomonadota bacterium]
MIIDRFGRQFKNLRLSLTAACNYACTYCVPDGKRLQAADAELDADALLRLVDLMIPSAGIEKVRITGGEPLLSPKFDEVIKGIMQRDLRDVSITTNGQLVPRKFDVIVDSGVKRMNVSLDTLDSSYFRKIARSGDLTTVLQAIQMLQDAGIAIKINMVPMRGENDHQIMPMLEYCLERGIELRFIELMNMGHLREGETFGSQFFGMQDILDLIGTRYPISVANAPVDSTAVRYAVPGGKFGIIANESEPFCGSCNRLRISSNGMLFGCLSNARSYDLRQILDLPEALAVAKLQRILGSALADKQTVAFSGEVTVMKFIGG